MNDKDELAELFRSCSQDIKEDTYRIYGCSSQNFSWILRNHTKNDTTQKAINSLDQAIKNDKEFFENWIKTK